MQKFEEYIGPRLKDVFPFVVNCNRIKNFGDWLVGNEEALMVVECKSWNETFTFEKYQKRQPVQLRELSKIPSIIIALEKNDFKNIKVFSVGDKDLMFQGNIREVMSYISPKGKECKNRSEI